MGVRSGEWRKKWDKNIQYEKQFKFGGFWARAPEISAGVEGKGKAEPRKPGRSV